MPVVPCCPKVLSVEKRNCGTPACAPSAYPYQSVMPPYAQPMYMPMPMPYPMPMPMMQQPMYYPQQQPIMQPAVVQQPVIVPVQSTNDNKGVAVPIISNADGSNVNDKPIVINITNSQDTNSRNNVTNEEANPVTVNATEAQRPINHNIRVVPPVVQKVQAPRPVILRKRPIPTQIIERVRPTIERIHEKPVVVERVVENRVCVDARKCKPYNYVEWS